MLSPLFFLIPPPPPRSTLFPYTTLFRSQPVFILHRSDGIEHLTQALARNRAIHAQIIRGNAPCRRKRRLAPGPKQLTLLLGTGDLDSGRAILPQKRPYPSNLLGHPLGRDVRLPNQEAHAL